MRTKKTDSTTFTRPPGDLSPPALLPVAVALVWRWIFHADFGLLNAFLYMIGVDDPPNWLASTRWALPAIIIMSIWQQIGFSMVLFLAGLQGIPAHHNLHPRWGQHSAGARA